MGFASRFGRGLCGDCGDVFVVSIPVPNHRVTMNRGLLRRSAQECTLEFRAERLEGIGSELPPKEVAP